MPTTFTLSGKFTKGNDNPSRGQIILRPTAASRHADDDVILSTDEIEVNLDSTGAFSIDLYATNDVGWSNQFQWEVTERIINGQIRSYKIDLTADTNLADVDDSPPVA